MKYINVAINLPVKNLFKQFTYAVPPQLDHVDVGWRVVVPVWVSDSGGVCDIVGRGCSGRIRM